MAEKKIERKKVDMENRKILKKFAQFSFNNLMLQKVQMYSLSTIDVKFEPTGPAPCAKSGPAGLLHGIIAMLPGSCRAQNKQPIMLKGCTAGLDAGF